MTQRLLLPFLLFCGGLCPAQTTPVYFLVAPDSFSAVGKWASTSSDPKDEIAIPQEVELDCFKNTFICVEATAEYYMGNPHITVQYPEIVRWDKDGLLIKDSSGICMSHTILINFADKTVSSTYLAKSLDKKQAEACAFLGAKKATSYTLVVRGTERWNKEHWKDILPDKPH